MKCMNKECEYYNEKWLYCCFNSIFIDLTDCPKYIPEQVKDHLIHDSSHTQFGRPQHCPRCGQRNPSGYELPKDCLFCGENKDLLKKDTKDKVENQIEELQMCKSCDYRYAAENSEYCDVCLKGQQIPDHLIIEHEESQGTCDNINADRPSIHDASQYEYSWDSGDEDRAPKNDEQEDKAKMRLIPLDLLREWLVPAYEEGLEKYYEDSWRKGFRISTMVDGLLRHVEAFYYQGENLDQETLENYGIEKTHLGAALFCILSMCNTMQNYPELDDRFKHKDGCPVSGEPCNCPTVTINGRNGENCEYFNEDTETCLYGKP